jgi:hypothetical protein
MVSGCTSAPSTTDVTVNPNPSAEITAPSFVCPNSEGHMASVPNSPPGADYFWMITNGFITAGGGGPSITFKAGSSGTLVLSVRVVNVGCGTTTTKNIPNECATSFFTVTPCRVVDTRGGPPVSPGHSGIFMMAGQCGIPSSANAVSLNVTVTQPTAPGHVLIYPYGLLGPGPTVSTLNYRAGQTRANNAIVTLGSGGNIVVESAAPAHVIIDVNGYFESSP